MKRVIILGAGVGQLNITNICKEKGLETIIISKEGDYPGFKIADKVYKIDVRDKIAILDIAKKEHISAIITDQLDISVPTVAFVAEQLDLPGIGYNCALKFQDKFLMKKISSTIKGVSTAQYSLATNKYEATEIAKNFGYPVVIKPINSDGSRGVFKVFNEKDLLDKITYTFAESVNNTILVEEYIFGEEYVVDGFTSNYRYRSLVIGKSSFFNFEDICLQNSRIFKDATSANKLEKRILDIDKLIVEKFGLKFGITHSEYFYNCNTDKIYLNEIAARGGGIFISSELIPLACGVVVNRHYVDCALGLKNDFVIELQKGYSGYLSFLLNKGTIVDINGIDEIKKMNGVYKFIDDKIFIGNKTGNIKDKSSRLGPFLLHTNNEEDFYDVCNKIKKTFTIDVVDENNSHSGIIW